MAQDENKKSAVSDDVFAREGGHAVPPKPEPQKVAPTKMKFEMKTKAQKQKGAQENKVPEMSVESILAEKPMSPEEQMILENPRKDTPRPPQKPSQDTHDDIESPKPKKSAKGVLFTFLIIGVVGILAFYGLLLWGLVGGELSNPLFRSLGIEPLQLKETLQVLTSVIFGGLALVFLISTVVKFFQWLMMPISAVMRGKRGIAAGITFFIFLFIIALWFGLFRLIDQSEGNRVQVVSEQIIATDPSNVIALTAPVTVEFDIGTKLFEMIDRSDIVQINWDFDGDGITDGSGPVVTHRFLNKGKNNGIYPVTAVVVYQAENNERRQLLKTREVVIANESVKGVIIANPETGPMPLRVEFSASKSVDPDGQIVYYEWDLNNDGDYEVSGEDAVNTEKVFSQIGQYDVRLRVTGTNNDTSVVTKKINVTRPEENIRAEISSNDKLEGFAPLEVTLSGENSFYRLGDIVRYEWVIEGEDKVVVNQKIKRTFREPGEYEIRLIVENDIGERNETQALVVVKEKKEDVKLSIRTTPSVASNDSTLVGRVPFAVSFDASASVVNNPVEWGWDFENDGIIDEYGVAVKHVFREAGIYNVRLTIIDTDNDTHEMSMPVKVSSRGLEASITSNPLSGEVPLRVRLDGSGSSTDKGEIISYMWEIPDAGVINTAAQIDYEFNRIGVFPVRLTVMNSAGAQDTTEMLIAVRGKSLKANFEPSFFAGPAPLEVDFNSLSTVGSVAQYRWKFGDGGTSKAVNPTHMYTKPGIYTVELEVEDLQGVLSRQTKKIEVTVPQAN